MNAASTKLEEPDHEAALGEEERKRDAKRTAERLMGRIPPWTPEELSKMAERHCELTDHMVEILEEAGGRLKRLELDRRMIERWGICYEEAMVPAQLSGMVSDYDYDDTVFLTDYPDKPTEAQGYLVLRDCKVLGIEKAIDNDSVFTPLAEPGVFTLDAFMKLSRRSKRVNRKTPEVSACIKRYADGSATIEEVVECLERAVDRQVEEELNPELAPAGASPAPAAHA